MIDVISVVRKLTHLVKGEIPSIASESHCTAAGQNVNSYTRLMN